jgi:sugar/nucleoside kinase (ribokinase family)
MAVWASRLTSRAALGVCIGGDMEGQIVRRNVTGFPIVRVGFLHKQYVYFIFACI